MKVRKSLVSNSSSSSFIIKKSDLTNEQIDMIKNHIKYAVKYGKEKGEVSKYFNPKTVGIRYDNEYGVYGKHDEWNVTETKDEIICETSMTNFDLDRFIIDKFGVKEEQIKEEGSCW